MGRLEKSGGGSGDSGAAAAAFSALRLRYGAPEEPASRRGFGAGALKVGDKIFAALSGERLLLKLPAERVETLIVEGAGQPFSTGPGRPKREWVTIALSEVKRWPPLSDEARAFVAGSPRR